MNKSVFLKIAYCVTASLVLFAVLLNFSVAPVMAADVNSLPAYNTGVIGSYDNDYVYVEDNGVKYSIPRNTVVTGVTTNNYPWSYPNTLEVSSLGAVCPVSYWYSPSNKQILVVSSSRTVGNSSVTWCGEIEYSYNVRSYSNGQFRLFAELESGTSKGGSIAYVTYWDCVSDIKLGSDSVYAAASAKDYTFSLGTIYGSDYSDLVCVFSSYAIKGFYESNDDTIITPDYYFDYQYLFYTESKGYVFVDSSAPIVSISNSGDPTKAMLYFEEECNKHVYTSTLGNSWIVDNSVYSMYGANYSMDYSYFYDSPGGQPCYVLVYCNDDDFEEEPLITPEYGNIKDITEDLNDFIIDGKPLPSGGRGNGLTYEEIQNLPVCEYYEFIIYGFTHEYYTRYKVVYDDGSSDYVYDLESGRWGGGSHGDRLFSYTELEKIPTIAYYLYDLNLTLDDTNLLIKTYGDAMHNDIKAVFDNVTITNTYLYDIKSLLVNTNKLLSDINSPSNVGGGSSATDITNDFLLTLDDDILVYLDNIYDSVKQDDVNVDLPDVDLPDIDIDVDNPFDELVDEDSIYELFNDTFVADAVSSIATGTLISGQFSNITSSGASEAVPFVNATITGFYEASGWKVQSVLLLGAAMLVVNVVVRKGV